ncbi:MAG: PAS domain S-box protein [Gemmatimonadetes bacterium]|jgi:two-component system CheB/CheR fusion protein|nr:PAS domain S-box protein [Gemmatimonadota bacterium]
MTDDRQTRERELTELLQYLHESRGLDLTGYKRVGLLRRLAKRMRAVGVEGFAAYQSYIESNPAEYTGLLDTLLINVTAFFRDDLPWDYLRNEIVPLLLEQKGPTDAIRVWCAGCATGEEAYSLAIVLAEALGIERFQERVKLYATDLDDEALAKARLGAYGERDMADVPGPIVEKYFDHRDHTFYFRKDLRRCVIFGRNDLVQDAPISRVDLLACRNTLMYFDGPTQSKILARFYFALNEGGFLFLGRAETMLTHATMFTPMDLRRRVFTKSRTPGGERVPLSPRAIPARGAASRMPNEPRDTSLRLRSFEAGMVPQFVIDETGHLFLVNARARSVFRLASADIGRPLQDLEISYRPYELRSVIEQAYAERQPVVREGVAWRGHDGEQRWFDISVTPLFDATGAPGGASVSFVDVTRGRQLQQQLDDSQVELETAYQELQSTNEELETTNEELHSTVEELETTNEELQSTNEELETMNEELHSTNEELQTINEELRQRSDSLNDVNTFLESMFTSLRSGIAVLDRDLRVTVWNRQAEELWGARAAEVETVHFLRLDIGLPLEQIEKPIRDCLDGRIDSHEAFLQARNRRGRAIICKTTVYPLVTRDNAQPRGVIVLMDELPAGASASDGDGTAEQAVTSEAAASGEPEAKSPARR